MSETGFSSPCRVAVHPQSSGRRGLARDHSRTFFRAFVVKRLRLFVLWLEGIRFRICGTVQRVSESRLMYCYDVFKGLTVRSAMAETVDLLDELRCFG